jgi:hypothetical protein
MCKKYQFLAAPAALTLMATVLPVVAMAQEGVQPFHMVVNAGAATCLPKATGTVKITKAGGVEIMDVTVENLAPNAEFDFFVLQVPKTPFGVAWYQGDIQTDKNGRGHQRFIGRFSVETFSVAQGTASAPVVFNGPFPDASSNPPFNPIQMYHLGLWFGSPQAAQAVGCPATVTEFNGEHNAGLQVLNTSNFPDNQGPLFSVKP